MHEEAIVARFYAKLTGFSIKATKEGRKYGLAIEASGLGDDTAAALIGQVNESIMIHIEQPQMRMFAEPKAGAGQQMTLDEAEQAAPLLGYCGVPATRALSFFIDSTGKPCRTGDEGTSIYLCDACAGVVKSELEAEAVGYTDTEVEAGEDRTCQHLVPQTEAATTPGQTAEDTSAPDPEDAHLPVDIAGFNLLVPCGKPARFKAQTAHPVQDADGTSRPLWVPVCTECKIAMEAAAGGLAGWIALVEKDARAATCENLVGVNGRVVEMAPDMAPDSDRHLEAPLLAADSTSEHEDDATSCVCGHARVAHEAPTMDRESHGACCASDCSCPAFRSALSMLVVQPEPEEETKPRRHHRKASAVAAARDAVA